MQEEYPVAKSRSTRSRTRKHSEARSDYLEVKEEGNGSRVYSCGNHKK